jgi:hypothetical protein
MHEAFPGFCASLPLGPVAPEDIHVDPFLKDCERLFQKHAEIDDDYPFVGAPFIYLPWMEAIMGCPVRRADAAMSAEPVMEEWESWRWERPDLGRNPWFLKLREMMQALVRHSASRYPVAHTQMRGPADVLSALCGATLFPLHVVDRPAEVAKALELIADTWIDVARSQLELIPDSPAGYLGSGYWRIHTPLRHIWLQEDAVALLSPVLYRELVLPVDRRIAAAFPCSAFHMHGTMLWSVEDLLAVRELTILELNHESALCDIEGTFAAWTRMQRRKPLVVWKQFDGPAFGGWLERVQRELSPAGLSLAIAVDSVAQGLEVKKRVGEGRWAS